MLEIDGVKYSNETLDKNWRVCNGVNNPIFRKALHKAQARLVSKIKGRIKDHHSKLVTMILILRDIESFKEDEKQILNEVEKSRKRSRWTGSLSDSLMESNIIDLIDIAEDEVAKERRNAKRANRYNKLASQALQVTWKVIVAAAFIYGTIALGVGALHQLGVL